MLKICLCIYLKTTKSNHYIYANVHNLLYYIFLNLQVKSLPVCRQKQLKEFFTHAILLHNFFCVLFVIPFPLSIPPCPHNSIILNFLPIQIFRFFVKPSGITWQGSQICPIWLILCQNISHDFTTVQQMQTTLT